MMPVILVPHRLLFLLAAAGLVTAQTAAVAAKKAPCEEATTQRQMTTCWGNLAKETEQKTESRFDQLRKNLAVGALAEMVPVLENAQTKWREYRDAYCAAVERAYSGGSMAPMQKASCRVRVAEARNTELRALQTDLAGLTKQR
jgi:uncharacterized protein YecT (DUF1311 family)